MRSLSRLVAAVVMGIVAVTGVVVAVPLALSRLWKGAATAVTVPLPPLAEVTSTGSTVYAANGKVIAVLHSSITRLPVSLSQVPPVLEKAVLDTEDHAFFRHGAIDFKSEIRAVLHDAGGAGLQGGSDITQQLVKNVYLSDQRTISRKIKEAFIAGRLQKQYSKDQILQAYLNTVYLGSGAYGMAAAAKAYWGEPIGKVTLPQAALLAGLIQNPSNYDPVSNPEGARTRRSEVLGRMLHYHDITARQYAAANAAPLPTKVAIPSSGGSGPDGFYVYQVERMLLGPQSPLGGSPDSRYQELFNGGLKIYTDLDPTMQAAGEQAVASVLPANSSGFEESLVSIDPATGDVRALVPGSKYVPGGFDMITDGARQPGSGFKLFTLVASLEHGDSIYDPVDGTSPCPIPFPGNTSYVKHPPHNDEGDGQEGVTTVQNATAQSLNCAYLRMAHQVGLPAVIRTAEQWGIPTSQLKPLTGDPAVVLGAADVTPLDMADAYATLADKGVYHAPHFLNKVIDRTGDVLYTQPTAGKRVMPADLVGQADAAFRAVVENGTGTAAALPGRPVAGKTGTNNGPTDAWFNGFTPQLETTVWMGDPRSEAHRLLVNGAQVYGGTYPAQTVHQDLAVALANSPVEQFPGIDYAAVAPTRFIPEVTGQTPGVPGGYGPPTTVPATLPGSYYAPSTTAPYYYAPSTSTPYYPPSTSPPATSPPPTSPPATSPPTTSPPTTSPPTTSPPTTAKGPPGKGSGGSGG